MGHPTRPAPPDRHDVLVLLRELAGVAPSAATVDNVIERSGGNPFFVEQLATTFGAGEPGRSLPPGLRGVLVARLAALPPATQAGAPGGVGGRAPR